MVYRIQGETITILPAAGSVLERESMWVPVQAVDQFGVCEFLARVAG